MDQLLNSLLRRKQKSNCQSMIHFFKFYRSSFKKVCLQLHFRVIKIKLQVCHERNKKKVKIK